MKSINVVLTQARQSEGVAVEENYLHRNKREGTIGMIEREREPQEQNMFM
ncbi:hypothetical protein [Hymenobacter yonginensis]|uniref:Uncharacterized protein n=1 Tax=Hymenobacter yonginensis TaxID=748197 RepID=A0ABY7PUY1_9BACT|nr:hypothetical protein [Hymenobacter yonginensis]WBO86716.1 hypothetical protein O9Z63_20765 [Hymenobacter yonginensis]